MGKTEVPSQALTPEAQKGNSVALADFKSALGHRQHPGYFLLGQPTGRATQGFGAGLVDLPGVDPLKTHPARFIGAGKKTQSVHEALLRDPLAFEA